MAEMLKDVTKEVTATVVERNLRAGLSATGQALRTIYFSKRFDTGVLRGIIVHGSITFPPECLAHYLHKFRKGTVGREALTRAKYTIVDASFQNYRR